VTTPAPYAPTTTARQRVLRERDVLRAVTERARALGGLARRIAYIGRAGAPDLLVLLPRRQPLLVEVKAPDGRLSPIQAAEHADIALTGHQVHVVWSLEDVDRLMPPPDRATPRHTAQETEPCR